MVGWVGHDSGLEVGVGLVRFFGGCLVVVMLGDEWDSFVAPGCLSHLLMDFQDCGFELCFYLLIIQLALLTDTLSL